MTSTDSIVKAISAAVFFVITGAAVAAEHSPAGVTVEAFNEVSRLVNLLGARVEELEKKNDALQSALSEVRQKNRDLERSSAKLQQRVDALTVPDIAPIETSLNSIRSSLEQHERALATVGEKYAAQNKAIAELESKGAAYASGIADLQSTAQQLQNRDSALIRRLDALTVPDLDPVLKEISAIKSVNNDQSKTIDALESKEEALMVAATGLQAQIDDIAMPDMTPYEAALTSLQSGVSANRRQIEHHVAMISELKEKDTALMVAATGLQAQIDGLNVPDPNAINTEVSALHSTVERLAAADQTMQGQIDNLIGRDVPRLSVDLDELKARLAGVTRTGDTIRFDGMNVQVTNGTGATDGEVNGLGNLIIGYNETINPFIDGQSPASDKSGSHNLVVGKGHNYSSVGSVVAGLDNVTAGNFSLAAGTRNQALGDFATVTGGQLNTSSGWYSSVTGGFSNLASENSASVSGGYSNAATGTASSVSGGFQVRAPGNSNWAAGGLFQQQ